MVDLNNLSKIKHIYRIYESEDKVLHCEKYPVIYINSKVVYFKGTRKQEMLNCIYINKVLDSFTEFYQNNSYRNIYSSCFDKYFWNMETNIQEIYADLKKQRDVISNKNDEERKRNRYERAKQEYEAALKEIKLLDKTKESLT